MNTPRHEIAPLPVLSPVPMVPTINMIPPMGAAPAASPPGFLSLADHLLQHVRLFGAIWLAVLVLGLLYLLVASPVYRAETLVQIDSRGPRTLVSNLNQMQQGGTGSEFAPVGFIQGELEILRSREIVSKAIAKTRADLDVRVASRMPGIGNWYARNFARGATAPVAPPLDLPFVRDFSWGGEKLRVGEFAVPRLQFGEPLWLHATPKGWVLFDDDGQPLAEGPVGPTVPFKIQGEAATLQVAQLEALPGTRFKLVANNPVAVYDDMARNLKIEEAGRQSGVIRVSLNDTDPRFAAGFLDALTGAYLEHHQQIHSADATRSLRFLESQLPTVKKELDRAEEALNQYRTGANTMNVTQENDSALRRMADLEQQRVQLELRRQQLAQRFTPNYPEAQSVARQLGMVSAEIGRLRGDMRQAPKHEKDTVRLQRDVAVNTQLYTTLLNNAQELRVAQAGMTGNARLLDPAGVLSEPVKPRAGTVLSAAAGIGFMLALGGVLLARALRPTVRSSDELERHGALQTLVSIPESPRQAQLMNSRRLWRTRAQPRVLALHAPTDPAVESLRSLRNATQRGDELEHSSVLITAATPEAGKTFVAANLAVLKAATGRRVLLVDLDLRAPRLHSYFGVDRNRTGLIDVIAERVSANEAIVSDVLPGLDLLLPGRILGNPGELLMQPRFEALVAELRHRYPHVIIDSAPILPVGDSLALGRMVDTTYLVVRSENNTFREVRDAVRRLESAGVGVDGLILNGVKRTRLAGDSSYHYYLPRDADVRMAR
ncbi:MAG: polysaccharide biosynthesis tyrosine autokinase [Burkholderiaceae bacterium]|nr:polysaccharide biosynthesis tyrosine autokinase [Burkholderiaceae bacterium]